MGLLESFFNVDILDKFLHPAEPVQNLKIWVCGSNLNSLSLSLQNVCTGCFVQRRLWLLVKGTFGFNHTVRPNNTNLSISEKRSGVEKIIKVL